MDEAKGGLKQPGQLAEGNPHTTVDSKQRSEAEQTKRQQKKRSTEEDTNKRWARAGQKRSEDRTTEARQR